MADFSDVGYASDVESIDSEGSMNFSGTRLRQEHRQGLDVQILDRLTPEDEPPGTSVYSFSEGGDFDMQLGSDDEPSGLEGRDAQQEGNIGMDVDDQALAGWMWQGQEGESLMDKQIGDGMYWLHLVQNNSYTTDSSFVSN